jgi:N-acetylglucosamine-6-phosphate deacetylase
MSDLDVLSSANVARQLGITERRGLMKAGVTA